jgi:anti-sigma regulatory factor (Ser/Thr protein kinase)
MEMTTVFYGVLEADRSRLTYARAGHVPGLIVRAEGAVEQLAAGSSPPLGAYAQAAAAESTVAFEENDLLLLCSDGLIERRREHLDDGLARLAEVAAGSDALGAQATCDHVMEHLTGAETLRDDAALLALRRLPADTRLFSTRVPAHASALAPLRQELRGFLAETPIGQTRQYDILLACGEAVANAVEHAYGEPGGTILVEILVSGEHVRLEVRDSGRWKEPLAGESRGRGISILTALAKELEISSDAGTHLRVVL